MLHTGKARNEDFGGRVVETVLYMRGVSACIKIEALRGSILRLSTFGTMIKHLGAAIMKRLSLSRNYEQ